MADERDRARAQAQRRAGFAAGWARLRQVVTGDAPASREGDAEAEADDDDLLAGPDGRAAAPIARLARRRVEAEAAHSLRGGVAKTVQLRAYLEGGATAAMRASWDAIAPSARAGIDQVIQDDLGAAPAQLFAQWAPTPFAAASLGQVHAATLHDGTEVAVKVQYPDIATAFASDLANPATARALLGPALASVDAPALEALRTALATELDYGREANALTRFAGHLADDPVVRVPTPVPTLCRGRVLTMARARGVRLLETTAWPQPARDAIGLALLRAHLVLALTHGEVNADPHPGNTLVEATPLTVWCLDFGGVVTLDEATWALDRALWQALVARDPFAGAEQFRMTLGRAGLLRDTGRLASHAMRAWERTLIAPMQGRARFTAAYGHELASTFAAALRTGALGLPPAQLMLWRQRIALFAVLGLLEPELDLALVLRAALARPRSAR